MMRKRLAVGVTALVFACSLVGFAAKVGDPAPSFSGRDTKGQTVSLATYKGKFVVLEWHNQGCPYVRKHYGSGNMQKRTTMPSASTHSGVTESPDAWPRSRGSLDERANLARPESVVTFS